MNKNVKLRKVAGCLPAIFFLSGFASLIMCYSCQEKTEYYTAGDFDKVPKTDVHLHINSLDRGYIDLAATYNFRIISPNVDSRIPVDEQLTTSAFLRKSNPGRFAFLGTFSVDSFGSAGFAGMVIRRIEKCMQSGASGIKIWKNIGMVLKDSDGRYVMVDDTAFYSVFRYLEVNHIPVTGHLGEPRNCWLPLEEMTDTSNYRYYKANPQYHMYLHPEAPTYKDQIHAMENLLQKHPLLNYTGAHLASLEWSVEELARRLDLFPNMKVDLSARMSHLQRQSILDREKVRDFFIRYQDRILYGTDITVNAVEPDPQAKISVILDRWRSNWIYLATDSAMTVKYLPSAVKGLHLPKEVIDRIYTKNAEATFSW